MSGSFQKSYDLIIVGAGPAGGHCARVLTQLGYSVLLVERAKSLVENNYSSGAAPQEIMESFDIPSSVVGSYWNQLQIWSTQEKVSWHSPSPLGPVLDFDKLRAFLIKEMEKQGGEFHLATSYCSHSLCSGGVEVILKQENQFYGVKARVLVDATGSERRVLWGDRYDKKKAMIATGIEYHLQVLPVHYKPFAHSLNFFLGHKWMAQGYGWIFPMGDNQLKVGVIRYFSNKNYLSFKPSYRYYVEQLLKECGEESDCLDKHGKTIYYTPGQKDKRYEGVVIAVGDTVSAINPLGCEGIRHALVTGQLAALEIDQFLKGSVLDFKGYELALKHYFGWRWWWSEQMMKKLFIMKQDHLIDSIVKGFKLINQKQLMEVIFHYRFSSAFKSYACYGLHALKHFITNS